MPMRTIVVIIVTGIMVLAGETEHWTTGGVNENDDIANSNYNLLNGLTKSLS